MKEPGNQVPEPDNQVPEPGNQVAIKIIDTSTVREAYVTKNLTREAKLLAKLQHPSIVYLYETIRCHSSYYLVTELATGGDLYTHIRKQPAGHLDEATAKCYGRQLVSALNHIHLQGIVHRDLKMENIMLKDARKKHIKIIDFGLSNWSKGENHLETKCGSPEYAAPELFLVGQKYGPEVDLWSLGVILYGMVTGQLPFLSPRNDKTSPEEWRRKLMAQTFRGLTTLQEKKISTISKDYKNLVKRLLEPVAHRRIPMREICRHPWLDDKHKNISNALAIFPSRETLKSDVLRAIFQEINAVTRLNDLTIDEKIHLKPYGEIGGIFNIKVHKLLGTGSADVFESSSSSITQKIRTVGRLLSKESSSRFSSANATSSSSIQRVTNDNQSGPPVLKSTRNKDEPSEKSKRSSSSACNSIANTNFRTRTPNSASALSHRKEQKYQQKNRDKIGGVEMIKSKGTSVRERPMTQPYLLENPEFSSSLARTTNYSSRYRPSCPGPSIVTRDGSYARLQKWMDNKDKVNRHQRYSAPDVGECNRPKEKNISTTQVSRVGRIAIPLVSTNWRNSRFTNMAQDGEFNGQRHSDQIFGESAIDRYRIQKSRQYAPTNSQILERGKTFSRPINTVGVQKLPKSIKNYVISPHLQVKK